MPLLLVAAIGAGCVVGYKVYARLQREAEVLRQAAATKRARSAPARDLGPLEWDAESGVYRPQNGTKH